MCYVEIYSTPGFKLNITPMYTAQQYIKSKCWWRPDFKIATLKVTFKLKYSLTVRESDPWRVVRVGATVVVGAELPASCCSQGRRRRQSGYVRGRI